MTESDLATQVLKRAQTVARRYVGSDSAKASELVNDIMEVVALSQQETTPDTPMPKGPPPLPKV